MPVTRSLPRRVVAIAALAGWLVMTTGCASLPFWPDPEPLPTTVSGPGSNGVDLMAPQEALKQTRDALEAASAFRVKGSSISGGPIDLAFVRDGGAVGTVTSAGSPVHLVAAEGQVYVKGDEAFISRNVGADAVKTLSGKWLLLPAGSTSGFAIFADGARFAAGLLDAPGKVERTKVAIVDGRLALGLVFAETGERVWVATRGDPLPIRFEEKGASGDQGVLRFVDYGKPVTIAAPLSAEILDSATPPAPTPTNTP